MWTPPYTTQISIIFAPPLLLKSLPQTQRNHPVALSSLYLGAGFGVDAHHVFGARGAHEAAAVGSTGHELVELHLVTHKQPQTPEESVKRGRGGEGGGGLKKRKEERRFK